MRIFFSVGEPSGDLHGSNLIHRLKSLDPTIDCVGYGGPKMAEAGCELHFELTSMAVMFLSKVIANLRFFFGLIGRADDYFRQHPVDAVVLVDYPGFNWWIARKAKKHGIPVFYYGVPQVWAWAPWRVRKIRKLVDHVLCKLPFESPWFARRQCRATYVGHPYFDELVRQQYDETFIADLVGPEQRLLTLLPGSRDAEVEVNLPILLDAAELVVSSTENLKVAVACFNDRQLKMAQHQLRQRTLTGDFRLFVNRTPELMRSATACIACSGSVSMELLYHRKPTVIVYRIKRWVMLAQAILLRTKFITLANLIAADDIQKKSWKPFDPDGPDAPSALMPEYLTTGNPAPRIAGHVVNWLNDQVALQKTINRMDVVAKTVALPGATDKAADYIMQQLTEATREPINENEDSRVFRRTG